MMLDKVSYVLPSIEAAQPGCKAGIEELCNMYNVIDKGKLIIQNCMECSSLYLVWPSICSDKKRLSGILYCHIFIFVRLIHLRLLHVKQHQ
jgi:hypothetical protein